MGQSWTLFVHFRSFQQQIYSKIVDFSGIRTRIVRVEGKYDDHLTTTVVLFISPLSKGTMLFKHYHTATDQKNCDHCRHIPVSIQTHCLNVFSQQIVTSLNEP